MCVALTMVGLSLNSHAQQIRRPEPQIDDIVCALQETTELAPGLPVRILGRGFADEAAQAAGAPGVSRLQNTSVEVNDGDTWVLCRIAEITPTEILAILPLELKASSGTIRVVSDGVASRQTQVSLLPSALAALVLKQVDRLAISDLRRGASRRRTSTYSTNQVTAAVFGVKPCLSGESSRGTIREAVLSDVFVQLDGAALTPDSLRQSESIPAALELDLTLPKGSQEARLLSIRVGGCQTAFSMSREQGVPASLLGSLSTQTLEPSTGGENARGHEVSSDNSGTVTHSSARTVSGSAGGSNGQIQYNCSGLLCGGSGLTWDEGNHTLFVQGLSAQTQPYLHIKNAAGASVYKISSGGIHFLTPYMNNVSVWHLNDASGNYKVAGGVMSNTSGWIATYDAAQRRVVMIGDVSTGGNVTTYGTDGYLTGALSGSEWRAYKGGATMESRARYGPIGPVLGRGTAVQWRNQADPIGGASDLVLRRDATGILAIDSGTPGSGGGLRIPGLKSAAGLRFVCVDTNGLLLSSTTPCSGN